MAEAVRAIVSGAGSLGAGSLGPGLSGAGTAGLGVPGPTLSGDATADRPFAESDWSAFLSDALRVTVHARFTRSRKTPVAVRPLRGSRGALEVRMHRLFAEARPEVRAAVASWIRSGRRAPRACARLDAYIAEILRRVPPTAAKRALVPRGEHHDLERIAREVCATDLVHDFGAALEPPHIGWGRRTPSRTRRSLRLGSFDSDGRIVRIHPVLDQPGVPAWFVRYVVFHELLHAVHPIERGAGDRWIHHSATFRRRERAYSDHRRALVWERAHLSGLIRSARNGTPLPVRAENRVDAQREPTSSDAHEIVHERPQNPRGPGVLRALQQLLFPDR